MSGASGTRLDTRNACLARADERAPPMVDAHQADGSLRRAWRIGGACEGGVERCNVSARGLVME